MPPWFLSLGYMKASFFASSARKEAFMYPRRTGTADETRPTPLPKYVKASFPAFIVGKEAFSDLRSAEAGMR